MPGNSITCTKFCDLCWWKRCGRGCNTANSSYDLSESKCLVNVLAIYPYEPLPDWSFHMPIFPKYPPELMNTNNIE